MRIALFLVLIFAFAQGCRGESSHEALAGVRLGMSPRDVRDRFRGAGEGKWQTRIGGATDDTALEWSADRESPGAIRARFEFHLGMLVAVRAHLREPPTSEHIEVTPKTVIVRTPSEGGTELVLLARDCPTHHAEAESLVRRAR